MTFTILFIDSRVADYPTLIDGLDPFVDWLLLDASADVVKQICTAVAGRTGVDAIHTVSHGSEGALYLGDAVLDSENVGHYADALGELGQALTETGDILLYGCNVALGETGIYLIQWLANFTRADVAASDDVTGGGDDSQLEYESGKIESQILSSVGALPSLIAESEPNDTPAMVDAMISGTAISGQLAVSYDDHGYALTVGASGTVALAFDAPTSSTSRYCTLEHYKASDGLLTQYTTGHDGIFQMGAVTAGANYAKVESGLDHSTGTYTLTLTHTAGSIAGHETEHSTRMIGAPAQGRLGRASRPSPRRRLVPIGQMAGNYRQARQLSAGGIHSTDATGLYHSARPIFGHSRLPKAAGSLQGLQQ